MKSLLIRLKTHCQQLRKNKAQGMVEFALALPVFLLLIMGIIEFGWLFYTYSATFSAAREASRYGASVGTNAAGVEHVLDCAGIRDAAIRIGSPVGVTAASVDIRYDTGPNDPTPWNDLIRCEYQVPQELADRIVVQVNVPYDSLIGILPSFTITNTSYRTIIRDVEVTGDFPPPIVPATYTPVPLNTPTPTITPTSTPTVTPTPTPTSTPEVWADLAIYKDDGTNRYLPGDTLVYTIVVTNNGPNDVVGATVTDRKPSQIARWTWTCTMTGASGCEGMMDSTSNFSNMVDLSVGGSITYTVTAIVGLEATGDLRNTARVAVPIGVGDGNPGNNYWTDTNYLPSADLRIYKSNGQQVYYPDQTITYSITVYNGGPHNVKDGIVTDIKPANISNWEWICAAQYNGAEGCTAAPDGSYDFTDLVTMPPYSTIVYRVIAHVSSDATGDLVNTAMVNVPDGMSDRYPGNNSATDTDVPPTADVRVSKSDLQTNYTRGSITYLVTVTNPGPSAANGVLVTDNFPDPAIVSSWTWTCLAPYGGATGCTPAGDGVYNFTDSIDLPPNSSITYQVTANILLDANTPLTNTVSITPPAGIIDPDLTNNEATDVDQPPVFSCDYFQANAAANMVDHILDISLINNTHYRGELALVEVSFTDYVSGQMSTLSSVTFNGATVYSTVRGESMILINIPSVPPDDWLKDGLGNYINRTINPMVGGTGGNGSMQLLFNEAKPLTVIDLYLTFLFNTNPPTTCRFGDLK